MDWSNGSASGAGGVSGCTFGCPCCERGCMTRSDGVSTGRGSDWLLSWELVLMGGVVELVGGTATGSSGGEGRVNDGLTTIGPGNGRVASLACSKATAKARTLPKRWPTSLASAVITTASTSEGTANPCSCMAGTGSWAC